jgi:hypothetical protein
VPITPKDKKELEGLYNEYGKQYGGHKHDYFALLYLRRRFKIEPKEVAHQVAFGGNDYGIDAYYVDREARNLYLFQFKWTEDHRQFLTSMERLAKEGMRRIFGSAPPDAKQNEYLRVLAHDLDESRDLIDRVFVHFVFKGDLEAAENSEGISNRREDVENKYHLLTEYFKRNVTVRVELVSDKPLVNPPVDKTDFEVRYRGAGPLESDGHRMFLGLVNLYDLYKIHRGLGQRFLDRNIRALLPEDNAPNRRLQQAYDRIILKGEEEPALFSFRHNGVTVAAEKIVQEEGRLRLHVPRLLNGAQTLGTLGVFLAKNEDNALMGRGKERLAEIFVVGKLIEGDPASDFVTSVTIANNQQNPVQPWMLRAMDMKQVDLADRIRDSTGIYYSRQENAFDSLSIEERLDLGIADPKDMKIRLVAQTFLSAQGEVDRMSRLGEVFETQSYYEDAFKQVHTCDIRALVLAYKVGVNLSACTTCLLETLSQKYDVACRRSRNLVWALTVQALLNDPKFKEYRESYGHSLAKEHSFRELLRKLSSSRVAPILRQLYSAHPYSEWITAGRFEKLRTREAFKTSMGIASDKYSWQKRFL